MADFSSSLKELISSAKGGNKEENKKLLSSIISELNDKLKSISKEADSYRRLVADFRDFNNSLREVVQESTREKVEELIKKLEKNDEINEEELRMIKLWLIGDAEGYVKTENNFNDWLNELERLRSEIVKLKDQELNLNDITRLRALLLDGQKLLPSIIFYLNESERIKRFEGATKVLDAKEKEALAKLLSNWLASAEM